MGAWQRCQVSLWRMARCIICGLDVQLCIPPCIRYDLEPIAGSLPANWTARAFGAVDGKVVDAASFAEGATHVICGPTADDQPAFSWLGFCPLLLPGGAASQQPLGVTSCNISHIGLVDTFDFQWQRYRGSLPWA